MRWHKGRGKLGLFDPLLGIWETEAKSERGQFKCKREFKKALLGTIPSPRFGT